MPTRAAKPRRTVTKARASTPAKKSKFPAGIRRARGTTTRGSATPPLADPLGHALRALEKKRTAKDLANLARFGITAKDPYGVSVANLRVIAKQLGRDHALAESLWATDRYEARMLACFVDDPAEVTVAQMDRWCRDFDNWGITDTACFCLFDRSPHAWSRVRPWSRLKPEHSRRAAFALLASLALHDKAAADESFRDGLRLVEEAASDERNFVKKGVLWALRAIGMRNAALHAAALATARRLAAAPDPTSRWIAGQAARELSAPGAKRRFMKAART